MNKHYFIVYRNSGTNGWVAFGGYFTEDYAYEQAEHVWDALADYDDVEVDVWPHPPTYRP